jgi:hypothetical protein
VAGGRWPGALAPFDSPGCTEAVECRIGRTSPMKPSIISAAPNRCPEHTAPEETFPTYDRDPLD